MSTQPVSALAVELEAALRAAPGVVTIYPVGPLVTTILKSGAHALGLYDDASPILVEQNADDLRVTVSIGVHASVGVPDTVRAATEAVAAVLAARGFPHPEIQLTVAHVAETSSVAEGNPA